MLMPEFSTQDAIARPHGSVDLGNGAPRLGPHSVVHDTLGPHSVVHDTLGPHSVVHD